MRINIYLPGIAFRSKINGGYKVVYQYANFLANKGHDVNIFYDAQKGENNLHILPKVFVFLKKCILLTRFPKWYDLDKKVKQYVVSEIIDKCIPDADVSIATAVETSIGVNKLSESKGKKFYLIQDYEKWGKNTEEMIIETYKYKMKKIVVSEWLKEIVDKYSTEKAILISNGIDVKNVFKCVNPIEKREPHSILMLYHNDARKGCERGKKIIKKLKKVYPDLKVNLFGFPKRDESIPEWVTYKRNASEYDVANLMNSSAIYVCTSLQEGFGLPGLEAMACGCALVTTDCKGIMEYATEKNAMISNVDDFDKMYENIIILLDNNEKRIEIANEGKKIAMERDLELKCIYFEKIIKGEV